MGELKEEIARWLFDTYDRIGIQKLNTFDGVQESIRQSYREDTDYLLFRIRSEIEKSQLTPEEIDEVTSKTMQGWTGGTPEEDDVQIPQAVSQAQIQKILKVME